MVERKKRGSVKLKKPVREEKPGIALAEGVTVIVTQAFCPNGHNLVRPDLDAVFDGHPGIAVFIECEDWSGEVVLSPIHGDHSKVGMIKSIPEGTKCVVRCPECEVELPRIAPCGCEKGGELIGLYLRPDLSEGDVIGICNVLGCYRSRVMDKWEILSQFVEEGEEE
jgi:hypothetical protein